MLTLLRQHSLLKRTMHREARLGVLGDGRCMAMKRGRVSDASVKRKWSATVCCMLQNSKNSKCICNGKVHLREKRKQEKRMMERLKQLALEGADDPKKGEAYALGADNGCIDQVYASDYSPLSSYRNAKSVHEAMMELAISRYLAE